MRATDFRNLIRRLSRAGFAPAFVRSALLPDWWDKQCEKDPALLRDLTFRVARFLDVPLESIERGLALEVPTYPSARLRRVRNVDADALGPAIHAGLAIAGAVTRCLREHPAIDAPSPDPAAWAAHLTKRHAVIDLAAIVSDLWERGIPVVHIESLPAPKFQGLACVVDGRPIILLGHANDEPARLLVHAAHEAGHIANGHCEEGTPVVDECDEEADDSTMERAAESFAWCVLGAGKPMPALTEGDFKSLARSAHEAEKTIRVDAGVLLWSHANRTQHFQEVQLALKALYRQRGGRETLRRLFDKHVDLEAASETDRALLRCVFMDPEGDGRSVRH